ncbi:hypothetical protein [Thermicanus aegyptius]|uniref:hypothetical protein n=1 Tax=Thermicanus aegyptius TaxID=94009 RepID=UPI00041CCB76|nr:hypothetical protein [Thermicanus aegyptius]
MKKILLVDLDNTLADTNGQLKKMGIDTGSYPAPVPEEVWNDGRIFLNAEPILPVVSFVLAMYGFRNDIIYLTARPEHTRWATEIWLYKHGLPDAPILHTEGKPKGEVVRGLTGVWGAIEDSPHEITSLRSVKRNLEIFIPDWPYNRNVKGNRLKTGGAIHGLYPSKTGS